MGEGAIKNGQKNSDVFYGRPLINPDIVPHIIGYKNLYNGYSILGFFGAVGAAEREKKVFLCFHSQKKNLNFFKNIVASALKSYIAKVTKN